MWWWGQFDLDADSIIEGLTKDGKGCFWDVGGYRGCVWEAREGSRDIIASDAVDKGMQEIRC